MHIAVRKQIPMKPWHGIIFASIFIIAGILVGIFSYNTINSYKEKDKTFKLIEARVIDYKYNTERDARALVVQYEVNDKTYKKTSNVYTSHPKSINSIVEIKYNPEDPYDIIWVGDSSNIILPIISVVFTIVGIVLVIISIKKMRNGEEYM